LQIDLILVECLNQVGPATGMNAIRPIQGEISPPGHGDTKFPPRRVDLEDACRNLSSFSLGAIVVKFKLSHKVKPAAFFNWPDHSSTFRTT